MAAEFADFQAMGASLDLHALTGSEVVQLLVKLTNGAERACGTGMPIGDLSWDLGWICGEVESELRARLAAAEHTAAVT